MMKKLMQLVLMIMLVMGMSVASQAATITVGSATGDPGAQVSIPVTIDDTAGRLDCSFSVSFDTTKLEYAGKASGDMGATLMTATTADINAAGKVQPIVQFEEGGATSGTICSFKFNIKTGAAGGTTPLTIGDITPSATYTGVSGSVTITAPACTIGPTIAVGSAEACDQGSNVEIPITIEDTAGRLDCSFSVSFDKTKLQYTGKASGDMNATVMTATTADINAAGKVQPIVQFEEGGATSGTIVIFKFTLLSDLAKGEQLDLTIGDLTPSGTYCGESGMVECPVTACTIMIEPETATVTEGSSLTFTSHTMGTGCATPVQVWSITTTIGSTITQEGVYTAGSIQTGTSATDTVKVTDTANGNISASAVVTVTAAPQCAVKITPALSTVDCGDEIEFVAASTGTCTTPSYTWSIDTSINSKINASTGVYKAGQNKTGLPVTDKITVTDTANGNITDTATVIVRDCSVVCLDLTLDITEGRQGQTYKIKLSTADPIFKNVPKDQIVVDFGDGITSKITDKSEKSLKVQITIAANATLGTRTVLVTTPSECAEATFRVTLGPSMVINPVQGRQGEVIEEVTITGFLTNFAKDKTKVKFGKNIEKDKKKIVDANTITLKIKIGKKAEVGARTVTVTTGLGHDMKEVVTGTFIVLPAAGE